MADGDGLLDRLAIGNALGKIRLRNQKTSALGSGQGANLERVIVEVSHGSRSTDQEWGQDFESLGFPVKQKGLLPGQRLRH